MAKQKLVVVSKSHGASRVLELARKDLMENSVMVTRLILQPRDDGSFTGFMSVLQLPGNREWGIVRAANPAAVGETDVTVFEGYLPDKKNPEKWVKRIIRRRVANYSSYVLVVSCPTFELFCKLRNGLYKSPRGRFAWKDDDGTYRLLSTLDSGKSGADITKCVVDESGQLRDGVLQYSSEKCTQSVTPGQMKCNEIAFRCTNLDGVDAASVVDSLTYGLQHILEEETKAEKLADISKLVSRLSQHVSPSFDLGRVGTFAVYAGETQSGHGYGYRDGFALLNATLLCSLVNEWAESRKMPWRLKESAVKGMGVQCRPYICKTYAIVEEEDFIVDFLVRHDVDPVVICRDSVTAEDQAEFDKLFTSDKAKSKFWGRVVVVTDDESLSDGFGFFTDLNGLKATFDLTRPSTLNVLTWGHLTKGTHTSTQLIPALMSGDVDEGIDYLNGLCSKFIEKKDEEISRSEGRPLRPSDIYSVRTDDEGVFDFEDDNHEDEQVFKAGQILGLIAPTWAREYDQGLYRASVRSAVQSTKNAIATHYFPVEGAYGKISVDTAADYGMTLLRGNRSDDETIVEIVCKQGEISGQEFGIMKRYPGPGAGEHARVRFVPINEYVSRILTSLAFKNREEACECASRARAQYEQGLVLIPANKLLLKLLGGADFDGDGVSLITEPELVQKLWKQKTVIVDIQ